MSGAPLAGVSGRLVALRVGTLLIVSTFVDDGLRELFGFRAQLGYLDQEENHIRLSGLFAVVYVLFSMLTQLMGGVYVAACAVVSPSALLAPRGEYATWRHVRLAIQLLALFVGSSLIIYGLGQPAAQHAQGRLIFLLRNAGMLGGLLLLLAEQARAGSAGPPLHFAARLCLALHALEITPASDVKLLLLCDLVSMPLAAAIVAGYRTRAAAAALALLLLVSDVLVNHFWWGYRYNDSIRYYFFEDAR